MNPLLLRAIPARLVAVTLIGAAGGWWLGSSRSAPNQAAIEAVVSSLVGRNTVTQARTTFVGCSGTQSAILVEQAAADVKKLGIGTFGWRMAAAAPDGDPQDLLAGTLEIKP